MRAPSAANGVEGGGGYPGGGEWSAAGAPSERDVHVEAGRSSGKHGGSRH